jgi:hypothetical protein
MSAQSFSAMSQLQDLIRRHVLTWDCGPCVAWHLRVLALIVFKGPVAWTKKKTELDQTATKKDRFVSNWLQRVATVL